MIVGDILSDIRSNLLKIERRTLQVRYREIRFHGWINLILYIGMVMCSIAFSGNEGSLWFYIPLLSSTISLLFIESVERDRNRIENENKYRYGP
jgi:hypothetical protein